MVIDQDSGTLEFASLIDISSNSYVNFILAVNLNPNAAGKAIGLWVDQAAGTQALPSISGQIKLHNIGMPGEMTIDGAFGDWSGIGGNIDPANDVISLRNNNQINKNVDIAQARASIDGDLFVYMSVNGNMFGGATMPVLRTRPGTSNVTNTMDTDKDTVPDYLDPLPEDFDNDGVNDSSENNDVDSDGILDYTHGGTDYWLNTTLPGNYAPGYANMDIAVYIGPVMDKINQGYDQAYVLVDSDDDPLTGTIIMGGIGIDHVAIVEGKNGRITSNQLYEFDLSLGDNPWAFIGNITAAGDSYRMELAINPASIGITNGNFTIYTAMKDWSGDEDILDEAIDSANIPEFAPLSTRGSPADDALAPKPRISISKTADLATASPGDVIMYTITYDVSKADAYDVLFTEIYPADVTFLNATPAPTAGDNIWDFGILADGTSGTIFINVTVDANVANNTILTNTIDATWNDGGTWPAGSSSTDTTTTVVIVPEFEFGPLSGILIMVGVFLLGRRLRY